MAEQTCFYPLELPHAGRVSIAQGASVATFTDVALSGWPLAGGVIWILPDTPDPMYAAGLVADPEDTDYENLELPLAAPWNGDAISGAKFIIAYGAGAHDETEVASAIARFRNLLQGGAGLAFDGDYMPVDAVIPPDGSIRTDWDRSVLQQKRNGNWEDFNIGILGPSKGRWDGNAVKHALSIVTGDVAIDFDDGPSFALTLSDDAEIQLPTNVEVGDEFDILFTGAGNVPTFATGFSGIEATEIRTESGDRSRLIFSVQDETGGTATSVLVSKAVWADTDVVDDGTYNYRSNFDDNWDEPPSGEDSNFAWTYIKAGLDGAQGEDGAAAVVTGTSTTSRTPGFGSQAFTTQEDLSFFAGQRLRAASDDGTKIIEGPCASYDPETGALTITCDYFKGSGAHADWNISVTGEPGQSFAFQLTWNEDNTDSDPGAGQIKADDDDLSAAEFLYIDDVDRLGNSISAALLVAGAVDNTIKADYTLQSEGGNTRVDGTVDLVADDTGYVRFGIADHSGATGFTAGTKVLLTVRPRSNKGADGEDGLDGIDYGLPFTFRSKTAVEEPDNLGDFNFDHGTLASVTTLVISKFTASAGNPDTLGAIAAWWAGGSTSDRASVTIKSRTDESEFVTGTISGAGTFHDETTDWYEIPFTDVTGPGITAGALCSVEVTRSGPEGVITGGVDSFNTRSGAVTATAGDYDASQVDYDNATSGLTADTVQEAIDEVEDRVDDLETEKQDIGGGAALSVLGRSANSTGDRADIAAANDGEVLRRSGTSVGFGTVATGGIADAAVTDAKLRNSAAVSIIGRSANSSGAPADIAAGANDRILARVSDALSFAQITIGMIPDALITLAKLVASTSAAIGVGSVELGHASDTTLSRLAAGVMAVEGIPLYPGIPITDKSTAYTLVLADAQTAIRHPAADTNNRTFTIPANGSVAYPVGTCITFINEVNTVTIAITTDTLVLGGAGTTGSRTLAAHGIATAIKVSSTRWYISGTGLT
jgi:hypothetical protein